GRDAAVVRTRGHANETAASAHLSAIIHASAARTSCRARSLVLSPPPWISPAPAEMAATGTHAALLPPSNPAFPESGRAKAPRESACADIVTARDKEDS